MKQKWSKKTMRKKEKGKVGIEKIKSNCGQGYCYEGRYRDRRALSRFALHALETFQRRLCRVSWSFLQLHRKLITSAIVHRLLLRRDPPWRLYMCMELYHQSFSLVSSHLYSTKYIYIHGYMYVHIRGEYLNCIVLVRLDRSISESSWGWI